MRVIYLGVLSSLAMTALGICAFKAMNATVQWPAVGTATAAGCAACILAGLPLAFVDQKNMASVMQASLFATVIHLMILCVSAAIVLVGHMPVGNQFVRWLGAQYAVTLIAVVLGAAQTFKTVGASGAKN